MPVLEIYARVRWHKWHTKTRYSECAIQVLLIMALVEEDDVNIRQYAKYLLKEGSVSDKRELLANLRSRLNYKDKKITMIVES